MYNAFVNYDLSMRYQSTPICSEHVYDPCVNGGCALEIIRILNAMFQNSVYDKYQFQKMGTTSSDEFEYKCNTPIIVDKKGSSALTVNSYVNSKEEVNLTESGNVEIKVFVKNSGKAASYDNKVVSNIPEGVEYVAGSASDNGIYDSSKNTVSWDLDYLDASS